MCRLVLHSESLLLATELVERAVQLDTKADNSKAQVAYLAYKMATAQTTYVLGHLYHREAFSHFCVHSHVRVRV